MDVPTLAEGGANPPAAASVRRDAGGEPRPYDRVEAALTTLVRAVHRVPVPAEGGPALERAAYALLRRLDADGPMRHGALATCFGLDPSTVSRQVQGLEEAGYVVRRPDPGDRRAGVIELTDGGREALGRTRQARREAMHALLADWTDDECDQFADYLERINDRLQQLRQAGHGHPAEGRPGHGHPAEGRPGHGHPAEGRPGHGHPAEDLAPDRRTTRPIVGAPS